MLCVPLLACFLSAAEGQPLGPARVLTPTVKQYERAEVALAVELGGANPFDPKSVALNGSVTLPSGRLLRVPGFWFQDYTRSLKDAAAVGGERVEVTAFVGKPEWRLRFSSGEVGVHRVVLEVTDASGMRKTAPVEVAVSAGNGPRPVRVSPRNKAFLEDGDGKAVFPIGQNLCMSPGREGTYYYERILPKLAAAGADYVRLWQEYNVQGDLKKPAAPGDGSFAGFPLETVVTGLGRYDLASAWKLDAVSDMCDRHGVRRQICFEMVVWWNRKFPHRWTRNPYNAVNGGPCRVPAEYMTSPACRDLAANRHRYSVARWGWSPNLLAWELWNEVDNLDGYDSDANAAWHEDLGGRLKAIDPFRHLVTTSWREPKVFARPEIDLVQAHSYWPIGYDAAEYAREDTDHLMRPYGKPCFFGEQGVNQLKFDLDTEGRVFHAGLWSSCLSGAAGSGLWWHWEPYIDKFNLYREYAPLAKFLRGIDWPGREWKPMKPTRPGLPVSLVPYGLAAHDRALVWLHDPLAYRFVDEKAVRGPAQKGATVNLAGLQEGNYTIEWWDTRTGTVVGRDSQSVRPLRHIGHGIELAPPDFEGDIAAKVIRQGLKW